MINPFEILETRLSNIETLLLDIKHKATDTLQSQHLPEQLLNIQQAAAFLNLTVPTMYTKVSKSELPVMKRGKRLYFSQTELLEYLKIGRKKSNAEIQAEAASYLKRKGK